MLEQRVRDQLMIVLGNLECIKDTIGNSTVRSPVSFEFVDCVVMDYKGILKQLCGDNFGFEDIS